MTKAAIMLKALIAKRRLKKMCDNLDISYAFCYRVAEGEKNPSYELMKRLSFLIPVTFWFDEASKEFIDQVLEDVTKDSEENNS